MMKKLFVILCIVLSCSGIYGAVGDVHSAQAEFSAINNPNGNWSYHVGQPFAGQSYDTLSVEGTPGDGLWEGPAGAPYSRIGGSGPTNEPGNLVGALPLGAHSPFMARWTVPAGVAAVEAHLAYLQMYEPGRQMRLHLMKNSFEIASMDSIPPTSNNYPNNGAAWVGFNLDGSGIVMLVDEGDTIDFVVDAYGTESASPGTGCTSVFTTWIKEISEPPAFELTVQANPAQIDTVTNLGTTQRHLPGFPIVIGAYPMVDCPNNTKYIFDHWEVNSNAQIADMDDPTTTVTILQAADAQITAHYTAVQAGFADCIPRDLWFDGTDDYVDAAGYKGITGTSSRTVAAWIRTDKPGTLLAWGTEALGGKWIFEVDDTLMGVLRVSLGSGHVKGTTNLLDDRCHHVAAVLQNDGSPVAGEVKLYVDGAEENITFSEVAINTGNTVDLRIGSANHVTTSDQDFEGFIGDVRLYDRALSSLEIEQLANSAAPANGLVAHWPLDESISIRAYDAAGSHDGMINSELIRAPGMLCAPVEPAILAGDINRDKVVNLYDLLRLAEDWLRINCAAPYSCMGADVDEDESVDLEDYSSLSKNWQSYVGGLRHMGYVVISPYGPTDGGDYGPYTPGTQTSGFQEAVNYALANHKDVYIIGGGMPGVFLPPVMYGFSTTLYIPPAENFRITGGYYLFGNSSGGNIIVVDSQKNSVFELGMMGAAFTDDSKANLILRPTSPRPDGRIAITNSIFDMSFQIGNGNGFGGTVNVGTGTILDASNGPIEHNFIRVMEINASKYGVILEAGEINHNTIHTPFTHLTHNPLQIKSGKYNSIFTFVDPSSLEPGIGVDVQAGQENSIDAMYSGATFNTGNYLAFGQNASNNLVYARGLPTDGLTNNDTGGVESTNKIITLNPAGFAYFQTPTIPASGQAVQNRTCFTVTAIITSAGAVTSWRIDDNNGNSQSFNAGLRNGQEIYLEPGEKIVFNYNSPPTWTWKAMVRQ